MTNFIYLKEMAMGKLYYELESIDINTSDKVFYGYLSKFFSSHRKEKVYNDVLSYDISKLSDGKKSIFVNLALSAFKYGSTKRDISRILKYDTKVYTMEDLAFGKINSSIQQAVQIG